MNYSRGSDTPEIRSRYYSNADVAVRLADLHTYAADTHRLDREADDLYEILRTGFYAEELRRQSTEALFRIAPHMLNRRDCRRWTGLMLKALDLATDRRDDEIIQQIYTGLGHGYLYTGNIKASQAAFEISLTYAETAPRNASLLLAFIGLLKMETFRPTSAFGTHLIARSLDLADELADPQLTIWVYRVLAGLYAHRGELEPALAYGQTALGYAYQWDDHGEIARCALALAIAYTNHPEPMLSHALATIELAQYHIEQANHRQYQAIIHAQRGAIDYLGKHFDSAAAVLTRAIEEFEAFRWPSHLTAAYHTRGLIYTDTERYHEAEADLRCAIDGWAAADNTLQHASATYALGYLYLLRAHHSLAFTTLHQAADRARLAPPSAMRDQLLRDIATDLADLNNRLDGAGQ